MLIKIISEYVPFVIFFAFVVFCSSGCTFAPSQPSSNSARIPSIDYSDPVILGRIASQKISESSGIASSRCQNEVLWTHNDSGDSNTVYAMDESGKFLGSWRVTGAKHRDWEDMSSFKNEKGECYLYIGDIGNNGRIRGKVTVYKFKEPTVRKGQTARSDTEPATSMTFSYPDLRHDAEALFVHPRTEDIYVITKRITGAAGVYKILKGTSRATKIADIQVPSVPNGMITGAAVSPDGTRVMVCDYFGGYEFVLPGDAENFDEIFKEKPDLIDLGLREQGEAVGYSNDGLSVYATSEHRNSPLIRVSRKQGD